MGRPLTQGCCWLWCGRIGVPVLWLGPIQWDGQTVPLMACEPCVERLSGMALAQLLEHDRTPVT
ncbi:hypothetical protein OSB71_17935 [Streptomyces sp. JHD 1]|nr:hypothetical protein [Streptomyces sp. JHD 1]